MKGYVTSLTHELLQGKNRSYVSWLKSQEHWSRVGAKQFNSQSKAELKSDETNRGIGWTVKGY